MNSIMFIGTSTSTLSLANVSEIASAIDVSSPDTNTITRIVRGWFLYVNHRDSIIHLNGMSLVPSSHLGAYYIVSDKSCSCPDYQNRGITCKHQFALMIHNAAAAAE